ncbi:MAG TPA: hypothetical protein VGK99_12695, partial [Acidobacteriota bacterium]
MATQKREELVTDRLLYIDGQWTTGSGGKEIAVKNPASGEIVAQVAYGTRQDARQALEAAARA